MLKGSKDFRGAFGTSKQPLYTLIFAFYCSFNKGFFEKNTKKILNPVYQNFCVLLHFQAKTFQKSLNFLSGTFDAENVEKYSPFFRQLKRFYPPPPPPFSIVKGGIKVEKKSLRFFRDICLLWIIISLKQCFRLFQVRLSENSSDLLRLESNYEPSSEGIAAFVKDFNKRYFWGDPPQFFWALCSPTYPLFIAFLLTNFRKFSKFGVLCPAIFLKNFPKFPEKFPIFFKIEKNYYYCTQNSPTSLYSSKFGQIFP